MIGRRLPAFLPYQGQGVMRAHTAVDEHSAGKQDAASHAVFTVDEHSTALLDAFLHPGSALLQLFDR